MREKKKTTIADIARKTGVSKATVSRILNGKPDVAPETRERVFQAIEEDRYVRSAMATQLTRGTSNLIGLLIPSLKWPWVLEVIQGITDHIEHGPYELVLLTASTPERTQQLFTKTVGSGFADGLIAILPPHAMSFIDAAYRDGFPVVVIDDRETHETEFQTVVVDNVRAAYQATKHLIDLGHQRIAYIGGPDDYVCSRERLEGYLSALHDSGSAPDAALTVASDFAREGGRLAADHLFSLPDAPTAIFAANDQMAFGVLDSAAERRLRVPSDVAVVGFDDITQAQLTHPPLTTVRQPMYEMGKRAADLLIAQIRLEPLPQTRIKLETELIVRESSGGSRAP